MYSRVDLILSGGVLDWQARTAWPLLEGGRGLTWKHVIGLLASPGSGGVQLSFDSPQSIVK